MPLTPTEVVTYTRRLAEAEEALHSLNTGTMARVFVDQNGERVEFAAANRNGLRAYIAELRTALGTTAAPSGPMTAWMK